MQRKVVRKNFSKAAAEYNRYAVIQTEVFKEILKRLDLIKNPHPLLDLGCGTAEGMKSYPQSFGIDISFDMCKKAKENLSFTVCAEGEKLPFKNESFKAVISSFSLQWMEIEKAIKEAHRVLKRDGILILAVPVKGSLEELFNAWQKAFLETKGKKDTLFQFPDENKIFETVKKNFEIVEAGRKEYILFPGRVEEAVKFVTKIGAKNPHRPPLPLKSTVKRFKELFAQNCVIKYKVLFLTAKKV
jgi:malonyl-CoA O-methyltransferase